MPSKLKGFVTIAIDEQLLAFNNLPKLDKRAEPVTPPNPAITNTFSLSLIWVRILPVISWKES